MDEERWLSYDDPRDMLGFLGTRKLRLFACACARRIWHLMRDIRTRQAVEISERFADGLAKRKELHRANLNMNLLRQTMSGVRQEHPDYQSISVANDVTRKDADLHWAACTAAIVARTGNILSINTPTSATRAEQGIQVAIIRDLVGDPFRQMTVPSAVLAWQANLVVRLAQAASDGRILPAGTLDNTRLAILADALEEAGCTDEQILTHLRGGGEHYRGCWVVDLLLGKK